MPRVQLPVYSPLSLRTIAAAAVGITNAGVRRDALERRLRAEFGAKDVLLTDSGTSALALALRLAAAARAGRPAALPAYSCWDLGTAAAAARVGVVLYDVDPTTLAPDADSLNRVLEFGVSSVVVAHLYGIPSRLDAWRAQCARAGAVLIEDAAQAFGALVDNTRAGSIGDFTVLSFARGKGLSGGRGGALLARGDMAVTADARAALAESRGGKELLVLGAQWLLGRPALYSVPASLPALRLGESVYHEPHEARGASGVTIAAVLAGWTAAEKEVAVRRRNAERLLRAARGVIQPIVIGSGITPGYLRLPLRVPRALMSRLDGSARRLGILRSYPIALADLPQLRALLTETGESLAGARTLADELITLPLHSRLGESDLRALERWLQHSDELRYRDAPLARAHAGSPETAG